MEDLKIEKPFKNMSLNLTEEIHNYLVAITKEIEVHKSLIIKMCLLERITLEDIFTFINLLKEKDLREELFRFKKLLVGRYYKDALEIIKKRMLSVDNREKESFNVSEKVKEIKEKAEEILENLKE